MKKCCPVLLAERRLTPLFYSIDCYLPGENIRSNTIGNNQHIVIEDESDGSGGKLATPFILVKKEVLYEMSKM